MHSNGKGMSSSALPYRRTAPSWSKSTPAEVVENICKLAKKALLADDRVSRLRK
jgi:small subunit ribosomal protein S13e